MVAIKTSLKELPETCDNCQWYTCRPHPYKGWSEGCELMGHCMDDDQEAEWIYDGNGRPSACPLIDVAEKEGMIATDKAISIIRKYLGYSDEKPYDTVDAIIEDIMDVADKEGAEE